MKRLISVCLLMLCVSFPVFGGHTVSGGRYCDCTPVEGTCPCCGTIFNGYAPQSIQDNGAIDSQHDSIPIDEDTKLGMMVDAFLTWLELKA